VTREADAIDFPPLLARTRLMEGDLADLQGDRALARERFESAFYTAARAGADDLSADAAISLTFLFAHDSTGHDVAGMWADLAQVLLDRSGQNESVLAARLEHSRAVLLEAMRDHEAALAGYRRSIELRRTIFGTDDPGVAASYNNIGNVYYDLKDLDSARESYEHCIDLRERLLGTAHPKSTLTLQNVGELEYDARAYEDALMYLEDARDLYVNVWGEEHLFVSAMHGRIGRIYYARGQYDVALAHHERALEIAIARGAPESRTAGVLDDVGQTYTRLGLHAEALPFYERALELNLRGEPVAQTSVAFTQTLIGANLYDRGQPGAALALLEDALTRATAADAAPSTLAGIQFRLAQTLWLDPSQRRRALEVARDAIRHYERGGPWNDIWKAEVQAWIDDVTSRAEP
jgi:eukaryotic-like serine/threonine-protein kinase